MVRYRVFNLFARLCVDGDERRPRVLVEAQWGPTTSSTLRYVGFAPSTANVVRRTAEGLSKREIIRCLKRYLARELFALLRSS